MAADLYGDGVEAGIAGLVGEDLHLDGLSGALVLDENDAVVELSAHAAVGWVG